MKKLLYVDALIKTLPTADEEITSITIEGHASTNDKDRHGDVVPANVWEAGLENYLKNPIVLAFHDHKKPIGKVIEHKVDQNGLWVKARISAAAEDTFNLIKDGVLTAFSIGFSVKDARYDQATDIFLITELELHEISVVSVPANQNTLFNLSKSFETQEEYTSYKMQFATAKAASNSITKEWNMDPKELEKLLAAASEKAAEKATSAVLAAQEKAAADKLAAEKAEAEFTNKVKAAVEASTTGAETLLAEVEKRLAEQTENSKKALEGLEAVIKEKSAELEAIQKSRMSFSTAEKTDADYTEKETAYLLSKIMGKSIENTNFGKRVIEKAGAHVPSATWELEVSTTLENEVRRRLVVAPTLRSINMTTNVMTLPVNPEAGYASWVQNAQFGDAGGASSGNTTNHVLTPITLNAYKVATREYLALEEEEDAIIALMPVIRDAMVRRVAKSIDKALLIGAGAGADPVKGLALYDAVSTYNIDIDKATVAGTSFTSGSVAALTSLRKDMGGWGLDPQDLVYFVSTEVYYDLLDDPLFQTMDKVGTHATVLTGQIGAIGSSPVLVSGEFAAKAATAVAALCVNKNNFLLGNQRGMRIDQDTLVETQRKVLVASMRTGMTQVIANAGVSALRYVA